MQDGQPPRFVDCRSSKDTVDQHNEDDLPVTGQIMTADLETVHTSGMMRTLGDASGHEQNRQQNCTCLPHVA